MVVLHRLIVRHRNAVPLHGPTNRERPKVRLVYVICIPFSGKLSLGEYRASITWWSAQTVSYTDLHYEASRIQ
jgi:hypothetical protein